VLHATLFSVNYLLDWMNFIRNPFVSQLKLNKYQIVYKLVVVIQIFNMKNNVK
jgi:hypothetical protein